MRLLSPAALLAAAGSALGQTPATLPPAATAPPVVATAPAAPACDGCGAAPALDCLAPCDAGPRRPRFYGDLAYMPTWIRDQDLPPLVTVGPLAGFGALGRPGTVLVYGGQDLEFDAFNGLRATLGMWLGEERRWGVEAVGFLLEQRSELFGILHNGAANNPVVLARPVIIPGFGENAIVSGVPGTLSGGILTDASSRMWSAEGNLVYNWSHDCRWQIDLLGGFRYFDLDERFSINEAFRFTFFNTGVNRTDVFDTRNQFYGANLGTRAVWTRNRLSLTFLSKLALGVNHQVVDRSASQTVFFNGGTETNATGVLVTPSNRGRETRDRFAVLPETTIQVGYRLTERLEAFVGYNFVYLSSAVRPADQIDRVVDFGANPTRPARTFVADEFWANSVLFGLGYKW